MSTFLAVNELIRWGDDPDSSILERILWIDEGNIIAYLIDVETSTGFPRVRTISELVEALENSIAKKLDHDPTIKIAGEDDLCERDREIRDRAWSTISSLVMENEPKIYRRKFRGPLVKKAAAEFKVTEKTVYKYLRKYWQRGKSKNALLPDYDQSGGRGKPKTAGEKKRGRPRKNISRIGSGINVDEDTKRIFRLALIDHYNTDKENTLVEAYKQMIGKFYAEDARCENGVEKPILKPADQLPSFIQFKYWHDKEKNIKEETEARKGKKKFDLEHRAVLGTSVSGLMGPGSVYQIDATVCDVFLVSRYNRKWIIGRPVIYVLIDVFSRLITGVYVGLEGPSWLGAMMALANVATDKAKYCYEYEIDITGEEWPCNHVPQRIVSDRGEMIGKNAESFANALNIQLRYAPPYRADWKGIVEQHFRIINRRVKPFLPGYVDKDFKERGVRDYRYDAKLDIFQFTRIILLCIIYHNTKHYLENYSRDEMMITDDVKPVSVELWNWGIANRSGSLRYYPEDFVKLSLMPRAKARVTKEGIIFKNLRYSCDRAFRELWFEKARKKTWQVDISYDPRNMNFIYIRDAEDLRSYDKCSLLESQSRYFDKTIEEIRYLQEYEKLEGQKSGHENLQSSSDLSSDIESVVKQAVEMTDKANDTEISQSEKVKGMRRHRRIEKEMNREQEAFDLSGNDTRSKKDTSNTRQIDTENPSRLELLRKKQGERIHGKG